MVVITGRHRRPTSPVWGVAAVVLCWLAVLAAAPRRPTEGVVHDVALFVHLGSMTVGFGAVLLVDWFGLRWLARRATLADVLRTAQGAHFPTWAGFAGLLVSGLFLGVPAGPKAIAVLVVGLNGIYAGILMSELTRHPTPSTALLARAAAATLISQLAWWTAVVLGYLNSRG
ncbi:hypothetical protein [Actinoplanes sp. HUAS TT8]|uniref:hypothetical protein n=1 Tax=Actinoplanes sp. HUAS TT8 TaxID=3447453 RepID=UPI003F522361